jgi:hypothetical protein
MVDDPVDEIARATGVRLTADFGPQTEAEVELALLARHTPPQAVQYDAVSIGILIVAITTLAWMVYCDHRSEKPHVAPEVTERILRTEIRREFEATPASLRITDVIIEEIVVRKPTD